MILNNSFVLPIDVYSPDSVPLTETDLVRDQLAESKRPKMGGMLKLVKAPDVQPSQQETKLKLRSVFYRLFTVLDFIAALSVL